MIKKQQLLDTIKECSCENFSGENKHCEVDEHRIYYYEQFIKIRMKEIKLKRKGLWRKIKSFFIRIIK